MPIKKRSRMTKSKIFSILALGLMLVLAGILFVACGSNGYKNVTVTSDRDSITLFVNQSDDSSGEGDEGATTIISELVTFTINNPVGNMDKSLRITVSNPSICQVNLYSRQNNSSTYEIIGLKGGTTQIEAKTLEGNKSCTITVNVRQYSNNLSQNSNSLYVSPSSALIPNASDFIFDDSATERDLDFYFYGSTYDGYILTETDLMANGEFINQFTQANLITVNGNYYIIFQDENGALFTLYDREEIIIDDERSNFVYQFMPVTYENGEYSFDLESAIAVQPGDSFKFGAVYQKSESERLVCARDFYVLIDIDYQSVAHEYGYRIMEYTYDIGTDVSYKLDEQKNGDITFIPSYSIVIEDNPLLFGYTASFATVYLKVSINSTSDLIKENFYLSDASLEYANCTKLGSLVEDGVTTYFYEINCSTNKNITTEFNVNFYYDGFENSQDDNVNFTYTIPIVVRTVPNTILVNNVDLNSVERVHTFYNHYAGSSYGWQEFVISVMPTDASYTNLQIDLTGSQLQLRYNDRTYVDELVTINDLSSPIYLKGKDGAEITEEDAQESLQFVLNYDVLGPETCTVDFDYVIAQGATALNFNTTEFQNGIYLDINDGYLDFTDIYADAPFESFTIQYSSGEDIATFDINSLNPYITYPNEEGKYFLNFSISAFALSSQGLSGTYTITLDNGQRISLIITSIEALESINVSTSNVNANVQYTQYVENDGQQTGVLYYAYNNLSNSYFDISIVANGNVNSSGIRSVSFGDFSSTSISLSDAQNSNKNFNINLIANGSTDIPISIYGYSVRNFAREEYVINYNIHVVVFNYVNKLNIYKEKDGFGTYRDESSGVESVRDYGVNAAYIDVYTNTTKNDALTAVLNYSIENENAYLFSNPIYLSNPNNSYEEQSFDQGYLYWTVTDASITLNNSPVDYMYLNSNGNNVYVITGIGTFNTETLEFVAFQNNTSSIQFTLTAHVRQFARTFSFTINVRISVYQNVEQISLQEGIDSLEFSSLNKEHSVVAYAVGENATNNELKAFISGGVITVRGTSYTLLDENSISTIESDGRYQFTFTANPSFIEAAEGYEEEISATITIVATDWLDEADNVMPTYQDRVITIRVSYANGTELNRFTLSSAQDVLAIKDNLSAHYKIGTTIDISSISSSLPLGQFNGSIIGINQYAKITGINITNNANNTSNYYGLFTVLGQDSYIEYISFEGSINIGQSDNTSTYAGNDSKIGLLAGENYGHLINVNVTINTSSVYIYSGYVGGIVGINYGEILQDLTLFESATSQTRSLNENQLASGGASIVGKGRRMYADFSPNIPAYYNGYLTVNYLSTTVAQGGYNTYVGGLVGMNGTTTISADDSQVTFIGSIKKIDSTGASGLSLTGYSNYTAYVLLRANKLSGSGSYPNTLKIGGLAGESVVSAGENANNIVAGYNTSTTQGQSTTITFNKYSDYKYSDSSGISYGNFTAGNGIIVGGKIEGYDYVGGVVGYIGNIDNNTNFIGITSRAFVKGLAVSNDYTRTAIIANINALGANVSLSSAYAIQAVDDGGYGADASMMVIQSTDKVADYYEDPSGVDNSEIDADKLAFGTLLSTNISDIMYRHDDELNADIDSDASYTNVYSFVTSRNKIFIENSSTISTTSRAQYYGDYIVASDNDTQLIDQTYFAEGDESVMSVSGAFNNKMISGDSSQKEIYYMFYFQTASTDITQDDDAQSLLDSYINRYNVSSILYPLIINGELTFTSRNTDILTIDAQGNMTARASGLVQVVGTSVLNRNNAVEFYIYVTNYFNPDQPSFTNSDSENYENVSIIYPSGSTSGTPIDDTVINLRGNNSANLVVQPYYSLNLSVATNSQVSSFNVASDGSVSFMNKSFNISNNSNVSAVITSATRIKDVDNETSDEIEALDELDISYVGQNISIRKNDKTESTIYSLTIVPRLQVQVEENGSNVTYYSSVNKTITDTTLQYNKGASSINHVQYEEVTLFSSREISETIEIISDVKEENPYYYITDSNGNILQGSRELDEMFEQEFAMDAGNGVLASMLFSVTFTNITGTVDLTKAQSFSLSVAINKNSDLYKDRYNQDIYGDYTIYILASSNTEKFTSFTIHFEQTGITSIIVDNYSNLNDAISSTGIGATSEYAYPGQTGFIAITINPDDADFDYIVIENDAQNYQTGNSSATFGLLARKSTSDGGSEIFEDDRIIGQTTDTGLIVNLGDIVNYYGETDPGTSNNNYYIYNGVIYVKYDFGSLNVNDESVSYINISLFKDGRQVYETIRKPVTIKLQYYVAVDIVGKEPLSANDSAYYASYQVARGLRYELAVNSYGFSAENINISLSNENLGSIIQENGRYYLQITNQSIDYSQAGNNVLNITANASQADGENIRSASSTTHIEILEFVFNYNKDTSSETEDLVSGMGDGIINVQVGTQTTFAIDMYDYIEYDSTSLDIVNRINNFFSELTSSGEWKAHTNLINDTLPDYGQAVENMNGREQYILANGVQLETYYFNSNGLNVTPVRTHDSSDLFYFFTYTGGYEIQNGLYVATKDADALPIKTRFVLNVYSSSSEDSPLPIYDYEDFINMQQGQYYILLNDIVLPNADNESTGVTRFTPLTGNFASLDGNGHTVIFSGTYDMGSLSSIGVFSSLALDSQIKNLNVRFAFASNGSDMNDSETDDGYQLGGLRTVKFITTASSFSFAGLVVQNNGIITNCHVQTESNYTSDLYIAVIADNASTGSYVTGFVAQNSGYITNSSVRVNIKSPFRIGGFVGTNTGKIAACYFREGKIINNSNQNQYAAGFAYSNGENGQIITSYVSGMTSSSSLYSLDRNSYVSANERGAGFIYQNLGYISDCYTDIYLAVTPNMAGFVYANGGQIKNSFSLSVLSNLNSAAAGFAFETTVTTGTDEGGSGVYTGEFSNCYYFYNEQQGTIGNNTVEIADNGFLTNTEDINTSLQERNFEGVSKLNAGQFYNVDENFADFAYSSTANASAVWFFSSGNTNSNFVDYTPTTETTIVGGENGQNQVNTVYETTLKTLPKGRLELTSANIETLSVRNFSHTELSESGGITQYIYIYIDDPNSPNRGSLHNPRLIDDAESMESEILQQTSSSGINQTNYRIISDISYAEMTRSELYKTTFAGVLEGNGMTITSISLYSEENLSSAGLFAQVGYSASRTGSIKNLTIVPTQVAFSNTNVVGTIAGTLSYGYLYDIDVESTSSSASSGVVVGLNLVGGIVGKATSSYIMKDVSSDMNATANYISSITYVYDESTTNDGRYSYAGGIAGYLGGSGEVYNAHTGNIDSVMGGRIGLLYGGIGVNAKANYNYAHITSNSAISLKPYYYGGLIAGEVSGTLSYSYVEGNGSVITPFTTVPRVATAVGGVVGLLNGGNVNNAVVDQAFDVSIASGNSKITYVGGLVGAVDRSNGRVSTLQDSMLSADVTGGMIVGGAIGYVTSSINIDSIAIKASALTVTGSVTSPVLGGIIAQTNSSEVYGITLTNSYCTSRLVIDTTTSGTPSSASVSGLVAVNNRITKMAYCFTTSIIDATIKDMRSIEYEDVAYNEREETTTGDNISRNIQIVHTQVDNNIENVYYFGLTKGKPGEEDEEDKKGDIPESNIHTNFITNAEYTLYYQPFITFDTRYYQSALSLNVTNYGTSSYAYSKEVTADPTNVSLATSESLYYSLFATEYTTSGGETYKYHINSNTYTTNTVNEDNESVVVTYTYNSETGRYETIGTDFEEDEQGNYVWSGSDRFNADNVAAYHKTATTDIREVIYSVRIGNISTEIYYDSEDDCYRYYSNGQEIGKPSGSSTVTVTFLSKRESINTNSTGFRPVTAYKDSQGNVYVMSYGTNEQDDTYKKLTYRNLRTGETYVENDGSFTSGNGVLSEIPSIKVWTTSMTALNRLYFESNLSWLNKI